MTYQRYRILLLEDEPAHAILLETILESLAEVIITQDTEQFFTALHDGPRPDLCIIDNRIESDPHFAVDEAGTQATEALYSFLGLGIPAILCTGYSIPPEVEMSLGELGVRILRKPFTNPAYVREFVHQELEKTHSMPPRRVGIIERYGVAWFKDLPTNGTMVPFEKYHLLAKITEVPPTDSDVKTVRLPLRDAPPLDILVLVVGEGFGVEPKGGQVIRVPRVGDSASVTFTVTPRESEEYDHSRFLRLHFYYQREWLQCIDFNLYVATSLQRAGPAVPPGEPQGQGEKKLLRMDTDLSNKPDLSLHWYDTSSKPRGFIVRTHTAEAPFEHLSIDDWEDLNRKLQAALVKVEEEAGKGIPSVEGKESEAFQALVDAGSLAFSRVFRDERIRKSISEHLYRGIVTRYRPPYIYIWTDRHHLLPWDLLFLDKDIPRRGDAAQYFWGMGCIVEKVCVGPFSHALGRTIDSKLPIKVGVAWNRKFKSVESCELDLLQRIASKGVLKLDLLDKAEPKYDLTAFLEKPWDIVEFACHSVVAENPLDSYLELTGGTKIPLGWLLGENFSFAKRPLVVISSCDSLHFNVQRTSNFIQAFIERGAQGVLGTLVRVRARFASRFVTNIYHELLSGRVIGRAVYDARNECWKRARTLLGLTYAYFGNARAQIPETLSARYKECSTCAEGGCLVKYAHEGDIPF